MVIGLLLGAIQFTRTPPTYVAKSDLLLNPRQAQVMDDQSVIANLNPDDATLETESEVLRSVALARRTVQRHGLTRDPLLIDPERAAEFESLGEQGANILLQQATGALRERIDIARKGLTRIIEVKAESETAEHAAALANAVVETYMASQIALKNEATKTATDWLRSRLADLRQEVVEAEAAVEAYRAEHELARAGGMTLNEQQLLQLNQSLARAEAERTVKEARLRELMRTGRGAVPADRASEALNSEVIARLRDQQADVTRRKAELASRYGERHPLMMQVDQELADINAQIADELRRIRSNLEDEVRVAAATEQSLRRALQRLEQTTAANEIDLVRVRDLEREAEATRILYQAFLARSKELTDQQSILQADASVLSEAVPPLAPSAPVLWRILAVSLGGSLVLGVGLAVLREVSYGGVTTNDQFEKHTGLNHLASIPKLKRPAGRYAGVASTLSAADFVVEKPQSTFSEAFGRLQLMIGAAADTGSISRVERLMFTSAAPGEGKSTTALAYARSCAMSNLKTVLIDCDLRRPAVHKYLGVSPRYGIADVINGRAKLGDALALDERTGLRYLPVASNARNPRAILGSHHMPVLFDALSDKFDRVIIDAPPVLPVPDAILVGKWVDAAVLVVKWRTTDISSIRDAVKELHSANVPVLGGVLAQVDWSVMRGYGGYYSYQSYAPAKLGANIIPWRRRKAAPRPAQWR